MKVIYIGRINKYMTEYKLYDVFEKDTGSNIYYIVTTDCGTKKIARSTDLFISQSEYREYQISKILDN